VNVPLNKVSFVIILLSEFYHIKTQLNSPFSMVTTGRPD